MPAQKHIPVQMKRYSPRKPAQQQKCSYDPEDRPDDNAYDLPPVLFICVFPHGHSPIVILLYLY